MYTRGRALKVTAVSAMVVLALTGFSSGHGHGSHGGGGCSSSRQDHDGSSTARGSGSSGSDSSGGGSDDSATSTSTSTGGGSRRARPTSTPTPTASPSHAARPLKDGTAVLVHCANVADPYATVEVRNPNDREAVFMVKMSFKDARGYTIAGTGNEVSVPAKGRTTLRVPAVSTGRVEQIAHCEVEHRAVADR
ncbi:hypothetical protein AB0N77_23795 [Streptomyces misionensis]|uniref:hypothetical protein n=1 Tax=Streptomyces misionensis TaxID=67331 RepID=UPI0034341433